MQYQDKNKLFFVAKKQKTKQRNNWRNFLKNISCKHVIYKMIAVTFSTVSHLAANCFLKPLFWFCIKHSSTGIFLLLLLCPLQRKLIHGLSPEDWIFVMYSTDWMSHRLQKQAACGSKAAVHIEILII